MAPSAQRRAGRCAARRPGHEGIDDTQTAARHGPGPGRNQDMSSDVDAQCLASDRPSNGTALMSRPAAVRAAIGHSALDQQCQLGFLDNGFRCALPAVAYVEFHMVGHCQRFDCDAHGNACGYGCADHLDALQYTAECTAAEMQPTALSQRLFNRVARCPTCGKTLLSASVILQVVVAL